MAGCTVTSPQLSALNNSGNSLELLARNVPEEAKKQPPQPYQIKFRERGMTLERSDGVKFECNERACTLFLNQIEMINFGFRNEQLPIVDYLMIPGFSAYSRSFIENISDPDYKEYVRTRFEKADRIYLALEKEFQVKERYQQWLNQPDPLDNYLDSDPK